MDLSDVPFDVPVILQSLGKSKNLQNPVGTKKARCLGDERDMYEHVILRRVQDDKVSIESARNGRFLQVRAAGNCVFDETLGSEREHFTMETNLDCSLFFISSFTGNALQCVDAFVVKCKNGNRLLGESWRILEPRATATSTVNQVQLAPDQHHAIAGKERQHFILELARYGMPADEIESIVTHLFDAPASVTGTTAA